MKHWIFREQLGESRLSRRPGKVFVRRQCGTRTQRPNAGPNAGPERQARTPGPNACPNALSWESPPTSTQNWLFGPVRIQCNSLVRARTLGRGIFCYLRCPCSGPVRRPVRRPMRRPCSGPCSGPNAEARTTAPKTKMWCGEQTRLAHLRNHQLRNRGSREPRFHSWPRESGPAHPNPPTPASASMICSPFF